MDVEARELWLRCFEAIQAGEELSHNELERLPSTFLSRGAPAEIDNFERPLLNFAARRGHLDAVKALHRLGLDPTTPDARGYTPLHEAAAEGCLPVVQ